MLVTGFFKVGYLKEKSGMSFVKVGYLKEIQPTLKKKIQP